MNIALIVFAGKGTRIHSDVPKQFIKINETELVVHTIKKFNDNPHIDEIVLVCHPSYIEYVSTLVDTHNLTKVKHIVPGGETRQESVRLGLLKTEYDVDDNIFIHDGDRPLVTNSIINEAVSLLEESEAVCPFIFESDELKEVSNSGRKGSYDHRVIDIQTPQCFRYGLIKNEHVKKQDLTFDDDIGLVEELTKVNYFAGDPSNYKVTTDQDLSYLRSILEKKDE